jgi:hypothetical protein
MARSCTSAAGCSALYSCGGDGVLLEWPGADSLTSDSVQPTNISSVVDGTPNAATVGCPVPLARSCGSAHLPLHRRWTPHCHTRSDRSGSWLVVASGRPRGGHHCATQAASQPHGRRDGSYSTRCACLLQSCSLTRRPLRRPSRRRPRRARSQRRRSSSSPRRVARAQLPLGRRAARGIRVLHCFVPLRRGRFPSEWPRLPPRPEG